MLYLSLEAPICSLKTKYALIRLKMRIWQAKTSCQLLKTVTLLAYFGNVYKGIGLKLKLNILTQVSLCIIYISSNLPSSIFVTFSTTSTAAASISLRIDFLTRNFLSPSFESNLEIDLFGNTLFI